MRKAAVNSTPRKGGGVKSEMGDGGTNLTDRPMIEHQATLASTSDINRFFLKGVRFKEGHQRGTFHIT